MFKHILVPLNGSSFSSRALRYAEHIAKRFEANIVLVQAVKPAIPITAATGITPGIDSPATAELTVKAALAEDKRHIASARRYLSRKARGIKAHNIQATYQVVVGDPAKSIIKLAQKEHIDLVVMSSHGKSGLRKIIQGSTVDTVIRELEKPVMVIRPRLHKKKKS